MYSIAQNSANGRRTVSPPARRMLFRDSQRSIFTFSGAGLTPVFIPVVLIMALVAQDRPKGETRAGQRQIHSASMALSASPETSGEDFGRESAAESLGEEEGDESALPCSPLGLIAEFGTPPHDHSTSGRASSVSRRFAFDQSEPHPSHKPESVLSLHPLGRPVATLVAPGIG